MQWFELLKGEAFQKGCILFGTVVFRTCAVWVFRKLYQNYIKEKIQNNSLNGLVEIGGTSCC